MKRNFILLILITGGMAAFGQSADTITLEQCYRLAEKNWPLTKQKEMLDNSSALKVKNINKNWLPQMAINGSASYQSDVTEFSIPRVPGLPAIESPTISKDWYKLTLDVNQSIYDGNVTSYSKRLEGFNLKGDQKSLQVELYKLKDRVNQVYFSILLYQQNEGLFLVTRNQLETKLKEIESGVANGTMMQINADLIRAELIKNDQQITEIRQDRKAGLNMLSELISTPVPENQVVQLPDIRVTDLIYENLRPENDLYNIQKSKVDLQRNMVTTKWNPKFYAYGQAGFGRPGFNMLSNSFDGLWIVGAKLSWVPWNWNQNKNEKAIYKIQKEILQSQQENFDKNLRVTVQKDLSDITKYNDLLREDQEMIDLRVRITKVSSSQLDNGVITSSDYISRLTEELQARMSLEIHRIQLERAKLSYLYDTGKL
jgi:outer membrane protein TolC